MVLFTRTLNVYEFLEIVWSMGSTFLKFQDKSEKWLKEHFLYYDYFASDIAR